MPHETGVEVNGRPIRDGIPTMGEIFRHAGYRAVYGGKWHLPRSFEGMTGFEKLIGGHGLGAKMDNPLASTCSQWLRANPREPFLMVASFMNPHDICQWIRDNASDDARPLPEGAPPPPANLEAFEREPDAVSYHRTAGYDLMSQAVGIAHRWTVGQTRRYLHSYYRMVEAVDSEVGRVLDSLREAGLEERTLVVFASDHGEGMGGHRWVQKASFYEESVRVPLMMAGPGIQPGTLQDSLVSLADILPTLCDAAGLPAPTPCRGISLLRNNQARRFAVSELRYGDESRDGRMIRTQRWKYTVFRTGETREQLFDLKRDPGETANLIGTPEASGPREELRGWLAGWIQESGDRFTL
jgi:arylsulfatase A-like enzyme